MSGALKRGNIPHGEAGKGRAGLLQQGKGHSSLCDGKGMEEEKLRP